MDKLNIHKRRSRLLSMIAVIVLLMFALVISSAFDAWAEDNGDAGSSHKEITIEVVEDIPADETEEKPAEEFLPLRHKILCQVHEKGQTEHPQKFS